MQELLSDPRMHAVVHDNIAAALAGTENDTAREQHKALVARVFRGVGSCLTPVLDGLRVGHSEGEDIMHVMRLLSDPAFRAIGLEAALAVRESIEESPGYRRRSVELRDMIHRIAVRLGPRQQDLLHLQGMVPDSLRVAWEHHRWELALDPSSVRTLATTRGDWSAGAAAQDAHAGAGGDSDALAAVAAGAAEQARILLGLAGAPPELLAAAASPWGQGIITASPKLVASCDREARPRGRGHAAGAVVCPLRFASLALGLL